VSSKKSRLEQAKATGSSGAKIAIQLLDNSEGFLSAIQVGITLIGIVTGVYGGLNIAENITPYFQKIEAIAQYAHEIALTLTVLIITFVSIVIGELVPKTIALSNPEKIAIRVSPAILYFSKFFFPFVKLLSVSTNLINNIIGIKKQSDQLTEAELRQMIKIASHEGVIEKEQNLIHEKVFYFSDKKAKHIMTHRTEIEWIDLEEPMSVIHGELLKIHHSRVICSKGDLDNFQGIILIKDYFKALSTSKKVNLSDLISQPIIVPEIADAQKVLDKLKNEQGNICFVVNEYGGFEGIITLHDIMENLIGQIPDENEAYEPDVFIREDKSVLVNGDAPVETLVEIIENFTIDFDKIEYTTIAGFIIDQIGKIPQVGDKFDFLGYNFEIIDIDGNRVDKVLISKIDG
jgi:putative hemolysin